MALLEINSLAKRFGGLLAVNALDLNVEQGEILGLIGPNGAGKTTVLNIIGGTLSPTAGKLSFRGEDITKFPPHRRCQRGIARIFQRNILFHSFTVIDNMLSGFHLHSKKGLTEVFRSISTRHQSVLYEKAVEILQFVGLANQADEMAINLPHGHQRALCLAIALATQPRLLLLDEPLTGMNAEEVAGMSDMIRTLRDEKGITSIVVEHNIKAVTGLCDRIAVLNYGRKIAEGSPKDITGNPDVIEAYLGAEDDAI